MPTYYVSPAGRNTNPGTPALPLATIPYAYSLTADGDTIYLMTGVHNLTTQLRIQHPLTITADPLLPSGSVTVFYEVDRRIAIDSSDVTLSNFTINCTDNKGPPPLSVSMVDPSDGTIPPTVTERTTIQNCVFVFYRNALAIQGGDITIRDCSFVHGDGGVGTCILVYSTWGTLTIEGNHLQSTASGFRFVYMTTTGIMGTPFYSAINSLSGTVVVRRNTVPDREIVYFFEQDNFHVVGPPLTYIFDGNSAGPKAEFVSFIPSTAEELLSTVGEVRLLGNHIYTSYYGYVTVSSATGNPIDLTGVVGWVAQDGTNITDSYDIEPEVHGVWPYFLTGTGEVSFGSGTISPYPPPIYGVAPSTLLVTEGGQVDFGITAIGYGSGTLYCTLSGTVEASDLVGGEGSMSGSVEIVSGVGMVSTTIASDLIPEAEKTMVLQLRASSVTGPILTSSASVAVRDVPIPTYSVASSTLMIEEGTPITFYVDTTNFGSGTLYWTLSGTIDSGDLVGGEESMSGSVSIVGDHGEIVITLAADMEMEGEETIIFELRTIGVGGPIVATSLPVLVHDMAMPMYFVSPSALILTEGDQVTFNIDTMSFGSGTLYWTLSGTVEASDLVGGEGVMSGSVEIVDDHGSVVITTIDDLEVETDPDETLIFQLRTVGTDGPIVATAPTVTLVDWPPPAYMIAPSAILIVEGGTLTFGVDTLNFGDGTLYYSLAGTIDAGDVIGGILTGSVAITSNHGSFSVTLVSDLDGEGTETMECQIRTGGIEGPIVATSTEVFILNSSPPTYSIVPSRLTVSEGSDLHFHVITLGIGDTTLYYTIGGTVEADDFTNHLTSGTVEVTGGTGFIVLNLLDWDGLEGGETLILSLHTGGVDGPIVCVSTPVVVSDTPPGPIFSVVPSTLSVHEGGLVVFTINTEYFSGDRLYYTLSGTVAEKDLLDRAMTGEVAIVGGHGVVPKRIAPDIDPIMGASMVFNLRTGSIFGPIVSRSPTVFIHGMHPPAIGGDPHILMPNGVKYDLRPSSRKEILLFQSAQAGVTIRASLHNGFLHTVTLLRFRPKDRSETRSETRSEARSGAEECIVHFATRRIKIRDARWRVEVRPITLVYDGEMKDYSPSIRVSVYQMRKKVTLVEPGLSPSRPIVVQSHICLVSPEMVIPLQFYGRYLHILSAHRYSDCRGVMWEKDREGRGSRIEGRGSRLNLSHIDPGPYLPTISSTGPAGE